MYDAPAMLRLISYLAPSIPAGFFELVAKIVAEGAGVDATLRFDERISGPLPGDENPFAAATADIGFVCAPTLRWLHDQLHLLPVPVPADPRCGRRPVYFGDVVVRRDSPFTDFEQLRGGRWAYNDRNSRSGWFSMIERVAPLAPEAYFRELVHAGSHLASLALVESGRADAAAIDSNALLLRGRRDGRPPGMLRVLESWGPFPIQPVVIRAGVADAVRQSVRTALLRAHERHGEALRGYGFVRFVDGGPAEYLRD